MSQLQVTGEAKIRDIQGPVVANSGVITALDGAASQYVRGDGTLADFPTSTGGGSSVSYYLNGSVNQGTFAGSTYYEMSKTPIIGAGTDFPVSTNGLVAQFITDANDPDLLEVPGGNFNVEFYFSVSNNTGNPTVYAELYKYDGTTFTLLGSSVAVPESLNQGTTIAPYYFAIPVGTAALALTDRIAIRIYANVDGRTVTLHTENSHLCQVVTTFSKGMVSLNNLTDQSQFITTGTSGTNFNIVSTGDTHTFNLPVASATNTGKLSSTDWSTFNNKVPYTGATASVDLGVYALSSSVLYADGLGSIAGFLYLKQNTTTSQYLADYSAIGAYSNGYVFNIATPSISKQALLDLSLITASASRTFTFPDTSGTLALTDDLSDYVPYTGATGNVDLGLFGLTSNAVKAIGDNSTYGGVISIKQNNVIGGLIGTGYTELFGKTNRLGISFGAGSIAYLSNSVLTAERTYTLPDATGTIALTSNLSSYVPYTGATTDVDLGFNNFDANQINGFKIIAKLDGTGSSPLILRTGTSGYSYGGDSISLISSPTSANTLTIISDISSVTKIAQIGLGSLTASRTFTLPDLSGTLALLEGTQTFSGSKTFTQSPISEGGYSFKILASGTLFGNGYSVISSLAGNVSISQAISAGNLKSFTFDFSSWATNTFYTYALPASDGTIALTSNLSSYVPYTGATSNVNLGVYDISVSGIKVESNVSGGTAVNIKQNSTTLIAGAGYISIGAKDLDTLLFQYGGATNSDYKVIRLKTTNIPNTTSRAYEFPNADGTIALTSNLSSYVPYTGATTNVNLGSYALTTAAEITSKFVFVNGDGTYGGVLAFKQYASSFGSTTGHTTIYAQGYDKVFFSFHQASGGGKVFNFDTSLLGTTNARTYTMPDASGTLALTSNLSSYLPLTGGTLTGALSGTSATFLGKLTIGNSSLAEGEIGIFETGGNYNFTTFKNGLVRTIIGSQSSTSQGFLGTASNHDLLLKTNDTTRLTIASTGAATFSSSVTAGGNITASYAGPSRLIAESTTNGNNAGAYFTARTSGGIAYSGGIYLIPSTSPYLTLSADNSGTHLNIVQNGNVGIGTSSPSALLHLSQSTTNLNLYLQNTSGSGKTWAVNSDNLGSFNIHDTTLNRLSITSGGNVLIGGTTAQNTGTNRGNLTINGTTSILNLSISDTNGGYLYHGGTDMLLVNAKNGAQLFYTNDTERMRITSGGVVNIGGNNAAPWNITSGSVSQVSMNTTWPLAIAGNDIISIFNRVGSNGVIMEFKYNSNVVGTISTNANSLPSDLNFKKDITNISIGLNLVTKLRPVHYRHKMDEDNEALSNGIIAQELEQALLDCGVEKNSLLMLQHKPNEKEGESQYWVDYTKMIPVLVKAIQEQQAQIEELKALINK